jgi:hypothetical protein
LDAFTAAKMISTNSIIFMKKNNEAAMIPMIAQLLSSP